MIRMGASVALFAAFHGAFILIAPEPTSDAAWYFGRATELSAGGYYSDGRHPTGFWPVGYPAFLASVFWIFGPSQMAGMLANLALGCGSLVLVFLICKEAFDERTAIISSVLLAVYPNHAAYTALLLTEHFFTFTLLLAVWLYMKGWLIPCGIALGIATLTKTQAALLLLLVLLDCLPRKLLRAGVVALALAVTVAPWMVRNYHALGSPILATNSGLNLLYGNNPDADGTLGDTEALDIQAGFSTPRQIEADRKARQLALTWIAENPGDVIALLPRKLFHLWVKDGEAIWSWQHTDLYEDNRSIFVAVRILNQAFYAMLLLGAGIAVFTLPSRWSWLGVGIAGWLTFVSLATFGLPRFHFPVMPFVCMYAGWAGMKLYSATGRIFRQPCYAPRSARQSSG